MQRSLSYLKICLMVLLLGLAATIACLSPLLFSGVPIGPAVGAGVVILVGLFGASFFLDTFLLKTYGGLPRHLKAVISACLALAMPLLVASCLYSLNAPYECLTPFVSPILTPVSLALALANLACWLVVAVVCAANFRLASPTVAGQRAALVLSVLAGLTVLCAMFYAAFLSPVWGEYQAPSPWLALPLLACAGAFCFYWFICHFVFSSGRARRTHLAALVLAAIGGLSLGASEVFLFTRPLQCPSVFVGFLWSGATLVVGGLVVLILEAALLVSALGDNQDVLEQKNS